MLLVRSPIAPRRCGDSGDARHSLGAALCKLRHCARPPVPPRRAFTAAAILESREAIVHGRLVDVSVEQLKDCVCVLQQ